MTNKKVIEAALHLAVEKAWPRISLADIAGRAGVPLKEAFQVGASKTEILVALAEEMRDQTLDDVADQQPEGNAQDRLFDTIMLSLEAMEASKAGLAAIVAHVRRDPVTLIQLRAQLASTMKMILEASGIDSSGLRGALRVRVIGAVWTSTFLVWLEDDDAGLARTMAHLDRQLRRLSEWYARAGKLSRPLRKANEQDAPGPRTNGTDAQNTIH